MKRIAIYTIALVSASVLLFGFRLLDEDFLKRVKSKLHEFNKNYKEERLYIQLDKTLYKPGDNVWCKAYLLDGATLGPSTTSSVVYVELIDPRGTVVKKSEWYVEEGTAHGDFALDKNVVGGLYTIRAFTQWMKNFPQENYFTKQVPVQTLITPRLLLKVEFEKKAYGKNDFVTAHLKVRNLKDEPLAGAEVKAQIKLDGNDYKDETFQTNANGEVDIIFQLPADLTTTDGLLQAVVSFGGVEESISRSVPIVLNKIQLRFFPEGGDPLAGVNSKIAFEAVNEFGKGADVEGIIVDEAGRTVSTFESYHMGMGTFTLRTEKGKTYSARITRPQGINDVYALPVSKPFGLALSIEEKTDSSILASIFSSTVTSAYLVGHVRSTVYVADKLQLHEGKNDVTISTTAMPGGVIVFTLFNAEGIETCERLSFINQHKTLHVELSTNRKEYLPGEKVELKVKTLDPSGVPVSANLSVAVVDDQLLTAADDKQDNLVSWMLLGSELRGKIEEPTFYFDKNEPKAKKALDNLLMVHGWRRFTWQEVFSSNRTLSYLPENDRSLSGFVLDSKNRNTQAEVVLVELKNRKRIAKVKADSRGQFLFRNIDASSPMILLTKRPNIIEVNGVRSTKYQESDRYYGDYYRYRINPIMEMDDQSSNARPETFPSFDEVDVDLSSDVSQLSEVVVTGYGISESTKALGSSTTRIVSELPIGFFAASTIDQLLAGRVTGITITQNGQPGSGANLQIRGMNTLSNRSEPLWVIDGVPLSGSINANFTMGTQLTPGNINSISVLKASEAMTLFGSQGSNGVILVETKTRADHSNFNYVRKKPKYTVLSLNPRTFTVAREFYSEPVKDKTSRNNFSATVFWKHTVVTDKNGEAKVQFYNNDATSAFRITAEGISGLGLIGREEMTYHTLLPFSLDARLPEYLGYEDTLKLPIRIINNTNERLTGKLNVQLPNQLRSLDELKRTVEVEANQTLTIPVSIIPAGISGSFPIAIMLEGGRHEDKITQVVNVHPVGFPVRASYSGKSLNKSFHFPMKDVEKGSVKGELTVVTDVLDDLFTGADAMLREPHGCFEQVSSSTFPNILALQFLKQSGRVNKYIEMKALSYIESGYRMLKGYEIKSGGFEWFGNPPGHEALTAFGLIEFTEMQKVFPAVDADMIARTKTWLLKRRNGDGTFDQNHGKYGFSAAPAEVNNAYIVYALSETGVVGLDAEYKHSMKQMDNTQDMYLGALLANAAINFGKTDDYHSLTTLFSKAVAAHGFGSLKIKSSITYSYGNSLTNETIALWALALMKSPNPDYKLIAACLEFIGSKKSFGMYGSTQATYLSLKAITEYHKLVQSTRTDGEILLTVNQSNTAKSFTKETSENIVFNAFADKLNEGDNEMNIAFSKTSEALPYSINLTWNTKTPVNSSDCKLTIETTLKKTEVKHNETVRLTIKLTNTTATGVPMSMAVVGIPGGLSLQPWQLKELKEKEVFDFYEIIGDKLAIYYRELGPSQTKEINLDLKADLPGAFLSAASCAYLYYASEFKHWAAGSKVKVVR